MTQHSLHIRLSLSVPMEEAPAVGEEAHPACSPGSPLSRHGDGPAPVTALPPSSSFSSCALVHLFVIARAVVAAVAAASAGLAVTAVAVSAAEGETTLNPLLLYIGTFPEIVPLGYTY